MILFHGTLEENIKNIKKNGLLSHTLDQWIVEVTNKKVCCVSNQPTSGEGGNASFFAYGNAQVKNQNGYLVVIEMEQRDFAQKLITIFDNKILDDYVRYHFFVREEFRAIGYDLFQAMKEHSRKDHLLRRLDSYFAEMDTSEVSYNQDQKHYYRKLYKGNRKNYRICDIIISDEFFDFIQLIGKWKPFYRFLELHFSNINEETYRSFVEKNNHVDNKTYWTNFYTFFPVEATQAKENYFKNWFSPQWLEARQQREVSDNCQILLSDIEASFLKGFIHITTPSGFAGKFRSCRSKSGFAKEVWKEVHRLK
ncbi:hypothetical protein UABAM_01800 [Candidatus Uabimicrobium amorphum]|uniref:Uncharacterized protein n=2 Tax=Uabimicrobium amorphum TaxID=2596890 RepID=A0A5S9IKB5_UABAM|nr:hypothetical protein UABAM_01800 [Candidatus Uabimicrobium amorphum]